MGQRFGGPHERKGLRELKPVRLIIVGSRAFTDWFAFTSHLGAIFDRYAHRRLFDRIEVVSTGCATGADEMARRWAKCQEIPMLEVHHAKWSVRDPKEGPRRNSRLINAALADDRDVLVVALVGKGSGTRDTVRRAKAAGLPVIEVMV